MLNARGGVFSQKNVKMESLWWKKKKSSQSPIKSLKITIRKIILFGSFAWGKPTNDSDIDLLVVKDGVKSMRQAAIEVDRSFFDRKTAMDILVCAPEHLEKRLAMGDFFAKKIVSKGKLLYEKKWFGLRLWMIFARRWRRIVGGGAFGRWNIAGECLFFGAIMRGKIFERGVDRQWEGIWKSPWFEKIGQFVEWFFFEIAEFSDDLYFLNKCYIPGRYPGGFMENFDWSDAKKALAIARAVKKLVLDKIIG